MAVMSYTTTTGHTIIPGKWTSKQEPAVILVPLTQDQLVALVEREEPGLPDTERSALDVIWDALHVMDEHEGIEE